MFHQVKLGGGRFVRVYDLCFVDLYWPVSVSFNNLKVGFLIHESKAESKGHSINQ